MLQNSKTPNVTKLKNSKPDKTQKLKILQKIKYSKCDKTQNVTKLKHSEFNKSQNLKFDKIKNK